MSVFTLKSRAHPMRVTSQSRQLDDSLWCSFFYEKDFSLSTAATARLGVQIKPRRNSRSLSTMLTMRDRGA